ncbi:hypothetical protein RND81_05G066800 [Saponaria officinalis]|uniref:MBD domain-containing protein n=1 Tax=Saponaria officinalis TaxID=3572 RepID=A0AAW1KV84_SAPOF
MKFRVADIFIMGQYFMDPVTNRRFRSKKEIFRYLENGTTPNIRGRLQIILTPIIWFFDFSLRSFFFVNFARIQANRATQTITIHKLLHCTFLQMNSEIPKRKKPEARVKISIENFKFPDVPEKVTWKLTDVYKGTRSL